jgi:hypothetical protein
VARVPQATDTTTAIYRGWMLRSEQYTAFVQALAQRQGALRTSPEKYRRAHELLGLVHGSAGRHPAIGVDHRRPSRRLRARRPRTTMRYDRARKNLDRHPNYILGNLMICGAGRNPC